MTVPLVPPQAITAARDAIMKIRDRGATSSIDLASAALEAALPHLAAAEREQAEYWRGRAEHAWKQLDEEAAQRIAGWPLAVAAEREACAQLAEQAKAEFWTGNRPVLPPCDDLCEFAAEHNEPNDHGRHYHPFAALLREARP